MPYLPEIEPDAVTLAGSCPNDAVGDLSQQFCFKTNNTSQIVDFFNLPCPGCEVVIGKGNASEERGTCIAR